MERFAYWRGVYRAWVDYPQKEGTVIAGKYRIVRFLGVGSYGLTYICLDADSGQEVVLKQAKPSKGAVGRDLLQREIAVLSRLKHPSIQQLITSFEAKNRLYMVSEHLKGQTVEDLIFERGAVFAEEEALGFVRELMEIVGYVHKQGIVHLDIRIPNVIWDGEQIHLIDFGLARWVGEPMHAELLKEAEKPVIAAEIPSDLVAVGHFLLFMLYSGYESDADEDEGAAEGKGGWQEELPLSPPTKRMLRKLLQIDSPYADTRQFVADLDQRLGR